MNICECVFLCDMIVKYLFKVFFVKLLDVINIKYLVGKIICNEVVYFMFMW